MLLILGLLGIFWLIRRRKQGKQARFLTRRDSIDEDLPPMSAVSSPYQHGSVVSTSLYSPPLSAADGMTSAASESQSFLPAGASHSVRHSVMQGRQNSGDDQESVAPVRQDTDANEGLLPPCMCRLTADRCPAKHCQPTRTPPGLAHRTAAGSCPSRPLRAKAVPA
jgi:hypothetical protein